MPIYEYACDQCGHTFEALQKMSEDPLVECPACRQPSLTKLVSAPNFQLKGTGWYETDFKHKQKPNNTKNDSKDSGKKDDSKKHDGASATPAADKKNTSSESSSTSAPEKKSVETK